MAARVWVSPRFTRASPDPVEALTEQMEGIQLNPPFQNPGAFPGGFHSVPPQPLIVSDPDRTWRSFFEHAARQTSPPPLPNMDTRPAQRPRASLPPTLSNSEISNESASRSVTAKGKGSRRASMPLQPSRSLSPQEFKVRCSGITREGVRCSRLMSTPPPMAFHVDADEDLEVFCHDHCRAILKPIGFNSRSRPGLDTILFETWIPENLCNETRTLLRTTMEKRLSEAEEPGAVYCFEIIDPDTPGYVHFKIGRSCNINKRLPSWAKQCSSRPQVLRGRYPENSQESLLQGKITVGESVQYSHRLERLVHIEVADLTRNGQYLDSKWHKHTASTSTSSATASNSPITPTGKSKGKSRVSDVRAIKEGCEDCGKVHKEIFTLKKMTGEYENQEFQKVIWPVIMKWGAFVESCL